MSRCCYKNKDGERCSHEITSSKYDPVGIDVETGEPYGYCIFHKTNESKRSSAIIEEFDAAIQLLIEKKDGNWEGFVFPAGYSIENKVIDFPLNIKFASFQEISFVNTKFMRAVDFTRSEFNDNAAFVDCLFGEESTFFACRFKDRVTFNSEWVGTVNYSLCTFQGDTQFKG